MISSTLKPEAEVHSVSKYYFDYKEIYGLRQVSEGHCHSFWRSTSVFDFQKEKKKLEIF